MGAGTLAHPRFVAGACKLTRCTEWSTRCSSLPAAVEVIQCLHSVSAVRITNDRRDRVCGFRRLRPGWQETRWSLVIGLVASEVGCSRCTHLLMAVVGGEIRNILI